MSDFARDPTGFRFRFGGIHLNDAPDAIPVNKYAFAFNVRAIAGESTRTRPGQALLFATAGAAPILDIRAYATLLSDDRPRYLAYDDTGNVYLDTGALVGSLANVGFPYPGVSMIPFRPNASPNPYMYIADGADYQKFSAPSSTNAVTQSKVGIAEPQTPPDATVDGIAFSFVYVQFGSPTLVPGGTAGAATTFNRVLDTTGAVLVDPVLNVVTSIQVTSAAQYQQYMTVIVDSQTWVVQDVFPPLPGPITIQSIYYFNSPTNTGRCIIVPLNLAAGPSTGPELTANALLTSLRRGALIQIGSEICLVWSTTIGPNGTISIETSTISTHTAAETLSAVSTITILAGTIIAPGMTINAVATQSTVTTGIGTLTGAITFNPFNPTLFSFSPEDYVHISFNLSSLASLNEIKILIDVGDGSFTENFYYYTVRPSDLAAAVANTLTQLAASQIALQNDAIDEEITANSSTTLSGQQSEEATLSSSPGTQTSPGDAQWSEILFPISALTRVGNDQTLTLQNSNHWQVLINASATVNTIIDSFTVFGSGQVDIGDSGVPYKYRVRPRSAVTGATGNPSPETSYGISPRRGQGRVTLPSAAYDAQITTWDVFRYGGTVTSWRFIGSIASTATEFLDNYGDDAATAGDELDFDNFEPWPTIDIPLNVTATLVNGTIALVTIPGATRALSYLPGNLVQIGGQNVYTLRRRPVNLGSVYRFEFEENAGFATSVPVSIYEPAVARSIAPYLFGPDASGTVFAVGEPLRPATLYFAKNNNPDSAPDTYNIEISPPSEPLVGGLTINGLAYVASPERWWALYPQPGNPSQRYSTVQQPITRGLAAPFGHATDGAAIYFWAKDSIQSSASGSLTDADLFNLFPHDGVPGSPVTYRGMTLPPPDYARAATFRLAYSNSYLYAGYQDAAGEYWNLVLDTRSGAWSFDGYSPAVSVFYHPEQQAGTVLSNTSRYPELVMGTIDGRVAQQAANANDLGGPIGSILASREYDGGDSRAPKQWGDFFFDSRPRSASGVSVTPMSLGADLVPATVIPSSASRVRVPISVGGIVVSDFLGVFVSWTDDYTTQTEPTILYLWQPSYTVQPARTLAWSTFGFAFGNSGFMHIREIEVAWVSTQPVMLSFAVVDGTAPQTITIPSSGGSYRKQLFPLTFNKGQLYRFTAASAAPFQFFLEDFEIRIGGWARSGPYAIERRFGGANVSPATI